MVVNPTWLRLPAIHCEDVPWWQEFEIYRETRNRRQHIGIGNPPVEPEKSYECPILEAKRYENLLADPFVESQADIARELGVTRARVSQIMGLLKLAPQIQQDLLSIEDQTAIRYFSERRLRPLLAIKSQSQQVIEFRKMEEQIST